MLPRLLRMKQLYTDTTGIKNFLSGGHLPGIGPVLATRITEMFGKDAVNVLAHDPERAAQVQGLSNDKANAVAQALQNMLCSPEYLVFLYSCGLTSLTVDKILSKYKAKTGEVITTDPYSMVEDVWRLNFSIADKIGKRLGIIDNDKRRLMGALMTSVKQYAEDGHLFATRTEAAERAAALTHVAPEEMEEAINALVASGRLIESRGGLYLPVFYNAEKGAAEKLKNLDKPPRHTCIMEDVPTCTADGKTYSETQRKAILKALNSSIMVLTGGPGTGKTTVLKGVVDVFRQKGKKVVLAAPTGKAVKRMERLAGQEAFTIHRLLGYRDGRGYSKRKIDADVIIVDEGSMMEQVLFDHLLDALREDTQVMIVGDVDQLPAIGAGDVLRDMINSGKITTVKLDENFRQDAAGNIAAAATMINNGIVPMVTGSHDLMVVHKHGTRAIHDEIINLVTDTLPVKLGVKPQEILVVTPQQIGPVGARQLNMDLQNAINPTGKAIVRGQTVFRVGDPVMQTANSSSRGIYNGETGIVVAVDEENQTLTVAFPEDRQSVYHRQELSELVLSYATTVHKLQGCETRYMVMPVTMAHKPMLYRNLLYTGVSRAIDLCVLVGEDEALQYAVGNDRHGVRNTNFAGRL